MDAKGNKIENWDISYKSFKTTYSEDLKTPANLVNTVGFHFIYEDITKFLSGIQKPKILEVGCGGARASLFLALRGYDVTCCDNSSEAIRLAENNFRSNNARGIFVKDDLLNSSLPAESFDCVMSFGLLEHFMDIRPPIRAITRFLKPGGMQIHVVIPKKISSRTFMEAVYFPVRFIKNAYRSRSFSGIAKKSFRDFPHYENSFSDRYYVDVFINEGNEALRCNAIGFLLPLIDLPLGMGNFICRHFSRPLVRLLRITNRSESRFMHSISQAFYIVCRKNIYKS